ncbi:protein TOPLESS-RELATED PROTEIN 2-like [Zingiber officinale]|uniref:protein TOPLESS-RELATED PROTEIN 2-like n=1 Tax=Zingiber officinale TaxID=94328 RepID=UPI001C4AE8E1|nr:protein TOPLESS-RELATED PROTEIN 2-like [Zingiber officinale]
MSPLNRDLIFLILQLLDEEKFKHTLHKLEQESGFYFNMKHFEDLVQAGEWDEVDRYLGGFTTVEDNRHSMKIFFEIRKQKYLEALDRHDRTKAVDILMKDLKVFETYNQELFQELTMLLSLENFRQNEQLSQHGDTKSARTTMLMEVKELIKANPLIRDKLTFPTFNDSRLRALINQSLNWQHHLCKNPHPNPEIKTLFTDHSCAAPTNETRAPPPANAQLVGIDHQIANSERPMKKMKTSQVAEVYDIPKTVVRTLNQGSNVMSLDFHPIHTTILLVGTNVGDIGVWEVGSGERLTHKKFKVWDITTCSLPFQASLTNDATVSVNRCLWSPEGSILGVAFSKHLVQIYAFNLNEELRQHLEIDAHIGSVNDIAFSYPKKTLSIITCGDDKAIKVWDASTGQKQYTFEGHEAPVYSVCPHFNGSIHFFFSTSTDDKIKAWSYDGLRSRVAYEAPGHWCTTMAYSADGTRLFSCGTSKDGDSHLVEWNETGTIKQTYNGFRKHSLGVVQFDTTRNRFLVAGDEFQIKFWDMDNTDILTTTDANGGLPAFPQLRFQKDGSLLAVTTSDNGIKILANADGQRVLRMLEVSRSVSKQSNSNAVVDSTKAADVKPRIPEETERIRSWKLTGIVNVGHLKTLRLPDSTSAVSKVVRLIYTNSGCSLLALGSNAVHKLWQWPCDERNPSGKSTASVAPQLRQPPNGILMTNERSDNNPEEATACIALSKNDSYATSASGGKVSLLNMRNFKVITTFMPTPPAATSLAFHPEDNNMIAAGMEDSSILIYNIQIDEVKIKLKGHQKKITGLAFSPSLNVLVSAGADAQLCVWGIDSWEKKNSRFIQAFTGCTSPLVGDIQIQFHSNQTHLLVVHERQIAIYNSKLDSLCWWSPKDTLSASVSSATFSCDSLLVYAAFVDGAVGIFEADSLRLHCQIAPSAYISSGSAYPIVIAAHPSEPNQIALGMSNGAIHVVEPLDGDSR